MEVRAIPVDAVGASALNTRKDRAAGTEGGASTIPEASIGENGLANTGTVGETHDGRYESIAGRRRLLAFRRLGRTPIRANVRRDLGDADATAMSLTGTV